MYVIFGYGGRRTTIPIMHLKRNRNSYADRCIMGIVINRIAFYALDKDLCFVVQDTIHRTCQTVMSLRHLDTVYRSK